MKNVKPTVADKDNKQRRKAVASAADKRKAEKAAERAAQKEREERERRRLKSQRDLENARRKKMEADRKERENAQAKAQRDIERQRHKNAVAAMKKEREAERAKLKKAREELAAARLKKRKAVYAVIKSKLKNLPDGFNYRNYGILPRTELAVSGDKTSVAARLSAAGITVSDLRAVGGKTRFKIRKKDMPKAIAILDEMCYNYDAGEKYGMGRRMAFWLSRAGLLLGAIVSVAGLYISYGYVWRIEIDGNEKLSAAAIESALNSVGVRVGRKKTDIAPIAPSALDGLEGVADASCEISGTTLYVRVLEAKDYVAHGKNGAYVSDYDATVTRIIMRSGTATVARGDIVKRGDMLANGDVYSTSGELLYTADCDAEIYGNVSVTFSADVSRAAVEYRRTGKSSKKTVFGLFGHSIGKVKSPYASYETVAHTANYDVLIPLYVTTHTFYETAPVEAERDIDEVARDYATAKIEEMNFAGDFEYSYNVTQSVAGLYSVHVFLSGEALISRGVEREQAPPQAIT